MYFCRAVSDKCLVLLHCCYRSTEIIRLKNRLAVVTTIGGLCRQRCMCRHVQALDERGASAGQACSLRVVLAAAVLGASSGDRATPSAAALACGLDPAVAAEVLAAAAGSAAVGAQSAAVLLLPAIRSALLQCADAATAQVIAQSLTRTRVISCAWAEKVQGYACATEGPGRIARKAWPHRVHRLKLFIIGGTGATAVRDSGPGSLSEAGGAGATGGGGVQPRRCATGGGRCCGPLPDGRAAGRPVPASARTFRLDRWRHHQT